MAKYLLLSTAALFMAFCAAQHSYAQELPSSGTRTFEILVSPMANNPVTFNEVRVRTFRSHDSALRLRADIFYESERADETTRDTWFDISLAPGKEWHVMQSGRFSGFYGAEIPLRYATSRQHREDAQGNSFTNKNNQGGEHFGIGVSAFAGLDAHFLDMLYAGVEVHYMVLYRDYLDGEVNNTTFDNDARDLVFGSTPVGRFRLGIAF